MFRVLVSTLRRRASLRSARSFGLALAAILVVEACASTVSAALLSPGSAIAAVGETDPSGGTLIAGGAPIPFVAATFTGTLTSSVLSGDPSNPWGGLTFTYLITNDAGSAHDIGRFTVNDFAGFLVDSSFQTPVAGVAPTFNDRSAGGGNVVGFTFFAAPLGAGTVLPGQNSTLLVLQTNASAYQATTAAVIDGSVATVPTWAPAVPEPGSIVLGISGIASLLVLRARRRRV